MLLLRTLPVSVPVIASSVLAVRRVTRFGDTLTTSLRCGERDHVAGADLDGQRANGRMHRVDGAAELLHTARAARSSADRSRC